MQFIAWVKAGSYSFVFLYIKLEKKMSVTCIAGMHRTGSSMVARMLNLCGIFLGNETDLIPAAQDNPDGFWENANFVNINNGILHHLKAGWDIVPSSALQPGWERSALLDQYRNNAVFLINEMRQHDPWGWKDPRNSLTLPFWQQLIPDIKVVVCLRNPIEVGKSLMKRGYSSTVFSARLWYDYYEKLLTALGPDNFIITHYDTYFFDCEAELRRLLSFLDLPQDSEKINRAAQFIHFDMKHCQDAWTDLSDFKNYPEIIEMYARLCAQAGPVFQLSFLNKKFDIKEKPFNETIDFVGNQLRLKDEVIESLQPRIRQSEAEKTIVQQELLKTKNELIDVQSEREHLARKLQEHIDWIANRDQLINELKWQLEVIHNHPGWKMIEWFNRIFGSIIRVLLPPDKKRTQFIQKGTKAYRVWRDEGTKSLMRNLWQAFRILFRRKHQITFVNPQPEESNTPQKRHPRPSKKAVNDLYVPIAENDVDPLLAEVKPIAFYLPQFHPIPENDAWWGRGFTEWTNVSKAKPNFYGHYQPRLPGELGYYDLRIVDVQKRQVQLAKKYGIYGFCFYYYWFNGRRLLERPVNQFLENPDIDFPFCLCWANENWTRCWDGEENNILIGQSYSGNWDKQFIDDLLPVFNDKRYIRVDGKPLLIVYRVNLLPDPQKTADLWRFECKKAGIGDIFLAVAQSFGISDPRPFGFDGAIEFPMHHLGDSEIDQKSVQITNPVFKGKIFDYRIAAQLMMQKQKPDYPLFKTAVPSWDNTARRQNDGHIFVNSSPRAYKNWLDNIIKFTKRHLDENNRFIFINAWNEWAEGNYLEPDSQYGYAYLNATAEAVAQTQQRSAFTSDWTILFVSHDAELGGAQIVLLNVIKWFKTHTWLTIKILCLNGGKLLYRFKELADTYVLSDSDKRAMRTNQQDLTDQLLNFCGGTPDLIYGNTVASGEAYHWLIKLGAPVLTHLHEMEMSINEYGKAWIDDVLKYSSHFIACSKPVQDNLINKLGVDAEKVSIVYSSVPSDSLPCNLKVKEKNRMKKTLELIDNKHLVFGCGLGMPFRKGADLFIEIGRILRREGRDDFHLYWIGGFEKNIIDKKFGAWSDYLNRLHQSELNSYVTFLGKKENPKSYFQVGDIFLLPSREDPFPLVALEAADCGLPTICFENVGTAELVEDDAGYIVPFEDVESMANRLIALMDDEDLRKRLGARAKEKYLDKFTAERTIPHILSVCRNVARKKPGVSVIVPNYNHEPYLPQRLESIFNQTYKDFEVILLDDASEDNSLNVFKRYANRGDVTILTNETNSGSPFKQWLKGFDHAKSDIWWIAESDDVCDPEFLESLLPSFNDQKIRLVYANSHVINENGQITGDYLNTEYLKALSSTKWNNSYTLSAEQEINDGLGLKNTILNISTVLFRKFTPDETIRSVLAKMRFAGDWYFIINAIKDGKVKYDARKLNFHRRHTQSVIGKLIANNKVDDFYNEISVVHRTVIENYKLSKDFHAKWEQYHRQQWKGFFNNRSFDELKEYYPFDEISAKLTVNEK